MIAITIFSLVLAAIYSTWTLILRAQRVGQQAAAQAQRQRIALGTIESALTGIESFQASLQYYSFVLQNGNQPILSFTARLPGDFPRTGRFIDPITGKYIPVRRLLFTVEPVSLPGEAAQNDLVLRQFPLLTGMDQDEQQTPYVLARNVKSFIVECSTNGMDWTDEWDNTNAIPQLIRVGLVLGGNHADNFGNAAPVALTRVISVPSQMMPAAVQRPSGGGLPAPVPITPPITPAPPH